MNVVRSSIARNFFRSQDIRNVTTSSTRAVSPLIDTDKDSKVVHRRKRPKVDTLYSSLFSDASERRV